MHEFRRKETTRALPSSGLPYQKKRLADKRELAARRGGRWRAELAGLEDDYHTALDSLLTDQQRERPPLRHRATEIDLIDAVYAVCYPGGGRAAFGGLVHSHGLPCRRAVFVFGGDDAAVLGE